MIQRLLFIAFFLLPCGLAQAQGLFFSDRENRVLEHSHKLINHIVSGDLDGDGKAEVIALNAEEILIHAQDSSGKFDVVKSFVASNLRFRQGLLGDLDSDGDNDLIVYTDSAIYWGENQKGSRLDDLKLFYTDSNRLMQPSIFDVNDDGKPDFVHASGKNLTMLINEGRDSFRHVVLDSNYTKGKAHAVDYNNDGITDIAIHDRSFGRVSVYFFKGLGNEKFDKGFEAYTSKNEGMGMLYYLDVDHDSTLDLLHFKTLVTDNLRVLVWLEPDSTGKLIEQKSSNPALWADYMALTDYDKDGLEDLVAIYTDSSRFQLVTVDSLGTMSILRGSDLLLDLNWFGAQIADVNGDSLPDLVAPGKHITGTVYWYENIAGKDNRHGNEVTERVHWLRALQTEDLNGNGNKEIVFAHGTHYLNDSYYGSLVVCAEDQGEYENIVFEYSDTSSYFDLFLADMNKDTLPDIVATTNHSKSLIWFENRGDYDFGNPVTLATTTGNIADCDLIDFNGDGHLDIALLETDSIGMHLFTNQGNGNFTETWLDMDSIIFGEIEFADLNGDTNLDAVAVSQDFKRIYVLTYVSATDYRATLLTTVNSSVHSLSFADLDNDGDSDLVLGGGNFNSFSIGWMENKSGRLQPVQDLAKHSGSVYNLEVGDYDSDGDMDILYLMSYSSDSKVYVLENDGNSGFEGQYVISSDHGFSFPIHTSDMNGDGSPDLFVPQYKRVVWYENISTNPLIFGKTFYDFNKDGVRDSAERPIAIGRTTLQPEDIAHYTRYDGSYAYYLYTGDYRIEYDTASAPLWSLTSDSVTYNVRLDKTNPEREIDFGLYPDTLINEAVIVLPAQTIRCIGGSLVELVIKNTGTTVLNGMLYLNLDSLIPQTATLFYHRFPDFYDSETLVGWRVSNFFPSESRTFKISLRVKSGGVSLGILGDQLTAKAYAILTSSLGTDTFAHDNEVSFACAYDPNDKLSHPFRDTLDNPTLRTETITYTIRFQNTGNDTAKDVVILDTLTDMLYWNSFLYVGSSHEKNLTISTTKSKVLKFEFADIMLPDSGTDYEGSMGFVTFQLKPRSDLPDSSVIRNKASIYFDQNPPIHTPAAWNTIVDSLPKIPDEPWLFDTDYRLYPNPNFGELTFGISEFDANVELQVYDSYGRLVRVLKPEKRIDTFDLRYLATGLYYIRVLAGGEQIGLEKIYVGSE